MALADEHRLVDPGVPGVARLEAGGDAEVVVLEGRRPGGGEGRHGRLVEFEEPVVLDVDVGPVVGGHLEADVDPAEAVRLHGEPLASAGADDPVEALTYDDPLG